MDIMKEPITRIGDVVRMLGRNGHARMNYMYRIGVVVAHEKKEKCEGRPARIVLLDCGDRVHGVDFERIGNVVEMVGLMEQLKSARP